MPFRDERPSPYRAHRSHFDRQAINAACHLLLGVVWLERRVAMHLVTLRREDRRPPARAAWSIGHARCHQQIVRRRVETPPAPTTTRRQEEGSRL